MRMWRKGNPFALLVGMQTSAATVESNMEIPEKIKNGSAFWPSNPTSGGISEETQNTSSKEHKHPYINCSIIYNCQNVEAAQLSICRWMNKTTMGHLCNGILLGHKKENFTLCDIMDRPGEHYTKWNKPFRERQMPYDFTHMWNLMRNQNNKQNRVRLRDGEQADGSGGGSWGGGRMQQTGKRTMDMDNRVVTVAGGWCKGDKW